MYTTEMDIENFLEEYSRSRVVALPTTRAVLNRALEFEYKFKKPFYDFSNMEAMDMYKSVHAISSRSLQNVNLTLKHAARYLVDSKKTNIKSVYEDITRDMLDSCVDNKKKNGLILSKEDLEDIQNQLLNWTDKGILLMLFLGAGSNWLRELTFFNTSQMSRKDGVIYFRTGKVIPITEDDYEVIKKACLEDELLSFGTTARISKVESHGFFKQRFNARSASNNEKDEKSLERRFRFIQRRLHLISKDLGVQLTSGGLQTSGLLHHLKQGVEESGITLREYVKSEEAIELARRYDILSEFAPQILLEKFERYFI